MTAQPTARTISQRLRTLVARVQQHSIVETLSTSQLATGSRQRARLRVPGSTRHLADVITARRGPAGVVNHARIAGALRGHPTHALDEILVVAIVEACHDLCGTRISDTEIVQWQQLVRRAAGTGHSSTNAA